MTLQYAPSPTYLIDPVAFFAALIGGPLLFTAATFWLLFVPLFALALGGIPYLVIGTPVLLAYLRHYPADARDIAWLACRCFGVGLLIGTAMMCLANPAHWQGVLGIAALIGLFGIIFSLCWGGCFGWLYTALAREFYTRPRI